MVTEVKAKDTWRKTARHETPHAVFRDNYHFPGWEWRVLQAHQTPEGEKANPDSSWFCNVTSPLIYGGWEMGDTWIRDIPYAKPGYRGKGIIDGVEIR